MGNARQEGFGAFVSIASLRPRLVGLVLTVTTVAAWAPVASFVTGALLAVVLGCGDAQGPSPPCVVAGLDVGPVLNTMVFAAWLILGVWPLMILTLIAWCGVLGWTIVRRLRARRVSKTR
jgi:hypothetical protein